MMAVSQKYEVIRDLNTVREAIIAENREILAFFWNKYRYESRASQSYTVYKGTQFKK